MRERLKLVCFTLLLLLGVAVKSEALIVYDVNRGDTTSGVINEKCELGKNWKQVTKLLPNVVLLSGLKNPNVIYYEGKNRTRLLIQCDLEAVRVTPSTIIPYLSEPEILTPTKVEETETLEVTSSDLIAIEPVITEAPVQEFEVFIGEEKDFPIETIPTLEEIEWEVAEYTSKVATVATVPENPKVIKTGVYDINLKPGIVEAGPLPLSVIIRKEDDGFWKRENITASVETNQNNFYLRIPVNKDMEIEESSLVLIDLGEKGYLPITPEELIKTSYFTPNVKLKPVKLDEIRWNSLNEEYPQKIRKGFWKTTADVTRYIVAPAVAGYFSMGSAPLATQLLTTAGSGAEGFNVFRIIRSK